MDYKTLQKNLRKHGYELRRSRAAISADNLGEYMVVEVRHNCVLFGSRYDATIDEVERFLRDLEEDADPSDMTVGEVAQILDRAQKLTPENRHDLIQILVSAFSQMDKNEKEAATNE